MIAVIAPQEEHAAVREFFELFKTPWVFYREGLECEVLLCANAPVPPSAARLVLIYSAEGRMRDATALPCFGAEHIPIYAGGEPVSFTTELDGQTVVRIGYDLFAEVRHLLSKGQPREFSRIPTLDLHIAVLRDLLRAHAIDFPEIPPVPEGYKFIACLTHDVDHPRIGHHLGDLTMFGFLFRTLIWWVVELARGRQTFRQVTAGWRAAFLLPLVHLGLAKDSWDVFDRYVEIEGEANSTFFVIPKKGDAGLRRTSRKRASSYKAADIADTLCSLLAAKREIAVHGIDAWCDATKGREELARVREATGVEDAEIGIRMHWLYFDEESPALLERAGYSYDSTVGYNDAVGYRAGTGQVFRPLGCERLLELPLHIMDTALFYQSYMNLSFKAARAEVNALIDNAVHLGGVLTINWHDRSLAPERLWDDFYIELVRELKRRGAWIPTAAEAVDWFRRRRAHQFENENLTEETPARLKECVAN